MPGEGGPGAPHMVSAASCHGGFCIHPPWAVDKRTELLRSIKICSPSVRVLLSALPCTPSHPDSAVGWSQGKNTRTRSDEHLRNCRAKESPLSSGFPPQAAHPPSGIKPWPSHCGAVAAVWAEGHPQASEKLHLQEECPRLKALRWWMHLPCKLYFCTTAALAGSLFEDSQGEFLRQTLGKTKLLPVQAGWNKMLTGEKAAQLSHTISQQASHSSLSYCFYLPSDRNFLWGSFPCGFYVWE